MGARVFELRADDFVLQRCQRRFAPAQHDCVVFEKAVDALAVRYLPAMLELHRFFSAQRSA